MADGDYEHRDRRIAELRRISATLQKLRASHTMQNTSSIPQSIIDEWAKLVSFETIGSDPMHLRDTVACAMWLKDFLEKLGFTGELLASEKVLGAPPVLFAERKVSDDAHTVLFYGHYDVQSPEPLDEWETPPFSLVRKNDSRFYARGANDDKGQFFAFLCGLREMIESGAALPNIKILLEGQEECGSAALSALAPEIRRKIAAGVLVVCDTNAAEGLAGAIVAGLRGVAHFEFSLAGPVCDLHSGEYGGGAPNAAQAAAEIVASLHDAAGRVAVEGFYDSIEPPSAAEEAAAEESTPSAESFEQTTGVPPAGGEKKLPLARRLSFEPTLEINGIHSGWGGAGAKTIIPAKAVVKLSMRLVPGQNPKRVVEAVKKHIEARLPQGLKLEFTGGGEAAAGFRLPLNSPIFRLAEDVLSRVTGKKTKFVWEGASIPVVSELVRQTGAAPLIVGFGLPEDRIHAPNESYSEAQFLLAKRWAKEILAELAIG